MLHIRMLGTYEAILSNGHTISFGSRKEQALFFYLVSTQTPSSRDTLAALLWSNKPETAAKNNLRTTLASLKRSTHPYVVATPATVAFNRELAYESDVKLLQDRFHTAIRNRDLMGLYQTQKLYHGEFLEGFHVRRAEGFEAWVTEQREQLHRLMLRALTVGAKLSHEKKDTELGLELSRRHLELEPWSEEAHHHVMQFLAISGRRIEAIRQYDICCQQLSVEFSVQPSKATVDLYNKIQAGTYEWSDKSTSTARLEPVIDRTEVLLTKEKGEEKNRTKTAHNLPSLLATFVGRQNEINHIAQSLIHPPNRLMSIVGLGGMGKSTLAIHLGHHILQSMPNEFSDGIYFIPLSGIAASKEDSAESQAIHRQIALHVGCNIAAGDSPEKQLEIYLAKRNLLLILDNFEHVINEACRVVDLLEKAPFVKILTTSRARLNVRGEAILSLQRLSLPIRSQEMVAKSSAEEDVLENHSQDVVWSESDAVAMFVQRAQLHLSHFELTSANREIIYQICHLVEGLPLGIELASSMLPMLSLEALAEGISTDLDFLETDILDIPEEQRTLRAVFERSWRLLASTEQKGLAALSLFPDTFHLDAAEQIAQISKRTLKRLISQALIEKDDQGRFSLHPSIRSYALQKLEQLDELSQAVRLAYSKYYLSFLAEHEEGQLKAKQEESTAKLQTDLHNVRFAWKQAVDSRMDAALNASMHTLFLYYEQQGLYFAGIDDASYALDKLGTDDEWVSHLSTKRLDVFKGRLHTYLGWMQTRLGHLAQAEEAIGEGYRYLHKKDEPDSIILCLSIWINIARGDNPQKSKELCQEAKKLVDKVESASTKALIYQRSADISFILGDYQDALEACEKAIDLAEEANWKWGVAISHETMSSICQSLGRYSDAKQHCLASIAIAKQHHLRAVRVSATLHLGNIARLQGNKREATTLYSEYRKITSDMQIDYHLSAILWAEGCMAEQSGDYMQAEKLLTQSLANPRHAGQWAHVLPTLGWALIGLGKFEKARTYFAAVLDESQARHLLPVSLDAQAGLHYVELASAEQWQDSQKPGPSTNMLDKSAAAKLEQLLDHPATTQQTRDRIASMR